ncbi:hypothetical protein [Enterocloster clostridioformis]|jgi:hypothetical protein|nr:hypothetical protein [Enterocloster clostridioformis]MDY4763370.1 hypothetical protein [Enterocloster clostridioformis]
MARTRLSILEMVDKKNRIFEGRCKSAFSVLPANRKKAKEMNL